MALKTVSNELLFLGRALPQNRWPSYLSRTSLISLRQLVSIYNSSLLVFYFEPSNFCRRIIVFLNPLVDLQSCPSFYRICLPIAQCPVGRQGWSGHKLTSYIANSEKKRLTYLTRERKDAKSSLETSLKVPRTPRFVEATLVYSPSEDRRSSFADPPS